MQGCWEIGNITLVTLNVPDSLISLFPTPHKQIHARRRHILPVFDLDSVGPYSTNTSSIRNHSDLKKSIRTGLAQHKQVLDMQGQSLPIPP